MSRTLALHADVPGLDPGEAENLDVRGAPKSREDNSVANCMESDQWRHYESEDMKNRVIIPKEVPTKSCEDGHRQHR